VSSNKKVMIADDDKFALEKASKILEAAGYATVLAKGGKEAAELAKEQAVDLILADYLMPDQSGLGLTFELRQRGLQTPILIMSEASFLSSDSVKRSGANDLLKKPYSEGDLVAAVKRNLAAS